MLAGWLLFYVDSLFLVIKVIKDIEKLKWYLQIWLITIFFVIFLGNSWTFNSSFQILVIMVLQSWICNYLLSNVVKMLCLLAFTYCLADGYFCNLKTVLELPHIAYMSILKVGVFFFFWGLRWVLKL